MSMAFSLCAMERNNEKLSPREYTLLAIDIRLESMKQKAEVARQLDQNDLKRHPWDPRSVELTWQDAEKFDKYIQPMINLLLARDQLVRGKYTDKQ